LDSITYTKKLNAFTFAHQNFFCLNIRNILSEYFICLNILRSMIDQGYDFLLLEFVIQNPTFHRQ